MRERREDVRRIEEALVRHFRSRSPGAPPPLLVQQTMMRLREERDSGEALPVNDSRLSGMVWRFALVTCLLAVILGAWGVSSDMQSQLQLAEFMLDEATDLEWIQEFGIL